MFAFSIAQNAPSVDTTVPADGLLEQLAAAPWIDQVGLALVGLFLILGLWRGLWWQLIRLAGLIFSVALARGMSPQLQPHVQELLDLSPQVSQGLSWFMLFLAGLLTACLLGLLGKRALDAMQLGFVDRAGGGLIGTVTGLTLHLALLAIISGLGPKAWTERTLHDSVSARVYQYLAGKHVLVPPELRSASWPRIDTTQQGS